MKVTHVIHLIENLESGGAERLLYTNLKRLDQNRFRSEVITLFPDGVHWKESIQALGVKVTCLNCKNLRDLPAGVKRLVNYLRKARPDLIHTHLWGANVIGRIAGQIAKIPVVSSIHNPDHEPDAWEDGAEVSLLKRRMAQLMDRWTATIACDRLIAVSEYVRLSASRRLRFPLSRIDLLYNPIDTDQFQAYGPGEPRKIADILGLPEGSAIILNVARVAPQKGLLYAIRAMPAIKEKCPTAHLVSVGATVDKYWMTRLFSEATSLGVKDRVHFLGPRRDIPDLLHDCDLFVFPSLYEGLGISLIEAMACGRACVASNTGPIPEIVRHGVNGWLVPIADGPALAEAVSTLLVDREERERLAAAAASSVATRFHPDAAARKLEAIYISVLEKFAARGQRSIVTTQKVSPLT
jgi:glycosyltransferase involved in cell wall biosynthesis